jgi:uncharacterized protein (DUF58 family)
VPIPAGSLRTTVGLTGRGWVFLASGSLLVALGMAARVTPAAQFGALVGLLPLVAAALTRNPRSDLDLQRTLSAQELATGDTLRVTVSVRGRFPRGHSLLLEDLAPAALGGGHRFALTGLSGQAISRPHYKVRVGPRGVHHLGPMRIHVIDRFGMVHRVVTSGGRDEVLVFPRVVPLDPVVLGGASVGSGGGHLGTLGAATDDVIPREYYPGDEVRRIDWKATARTGGLMVRSEESPWRSAVTLVLDLREGDHHGHEPDSSLDASLSLAASIGSLALENGWELSVRTTDDLHIFSGSPLTGVEQERRGLRRALATVPVSHMPVPSASLRHSADTAAVGPLILIAGSVAPDSARVLAAIGGHSTARLLVAVSSEQWRPADNAAWGRGHTIGPANAQAALAQFQLAGWRISQMGRDTSLPDVWAGLAVPR